MDINKLRESINEIDSKIIELLNERFKSSMAIGEYKKSNDLPVYDFRREHEILDVLVSKIKEPMSEKILRDIYNEILSASRELQQKTKIAFFGLKQSYSHLAAIKCFGKACEYISGQTINDVFLEVEKGNARFGVVPVENSTEGIVNHTFDLMMETDVNIYSEILLNIHHN